MLRMTICSFFSGLAIIPTSRLEVEDLCEYALTRAWDQQIPKENDRKQIIEQIREYENRMENAHNLVATKAIDPVDFREMKADYSARIDKLKAKLSACENEETEFIDLLIPGIKSLFRMDSIYENGDTEKKRQIIGSIYPEKFTFDGFRVRTTRVNEAARLIYSVGAGLDKNKTGQNGLVSTLSCQVGTTGLPAGGSAVLGDPKWGRPKQKPAQPFGLLPFLAFRFRASSTRPAQNAKPPLSRRLC